MSPTYAMSLGYSRIPLPGMNREEAIAHVQEIREQQPDLAAMRVLEVVTPYLSFVIHDTTPTQGETA